MPHPLNGADAPTLARVFRDAGGPDRAADALALRAAAWARAPFSALERALLERGLPRIEDGPGPVFILGHWRSGTTHLYNLMSLGNWGCVRPVSAGLPHDMLLLGRLLRPLLERQLPETRWIDAIPVTPDAPQEDETAIANMSPLSFYHGLYFPRAFDRLIDRGLFFDGCSEREIAEWRRCFRRFLAKVAREQDRPLLIKNPVYTARPRMLLDMFPHARFIHIRRNPHDAFRSMRNFHGRLLEAMALQAVPPELDVDATILRVYSRMMTAYDEQTADWEAPRLVELSYETLDARPLEALERVHDALELPGFDALAPRAQAYLDALGVFPRNVLPRDAETERKVEAALGRWRSRWNYPVPASQGGDA
jgi:hypothetical protein